MWREGEVWRVLLSKALQLPRLFIVMDKKTQQSPIMVQAEPGNNKMCKLLFK